MAAGEEKDSDFYAVLGLKKECTSTELRNAYKKLALRWHPDRCSASGNSKFVEEAKKKFQAIQEAYSVLSDSDKRFMYDVGVYDENDDDENGMGDFLNEMATMMSQTKPNEIGWDPGDHQRGWTIWALYARWHALWILPLTLWVHEWEKGEESFEELQELFEEMFQEDMEGFSSTSEYVNTTSCSTSSYASYCEASNSNNKRNSSNMDSVKTKADNSSAFNADSQSFCLGAEHQRDSRKGKGARGGIPGGGGSKRRNGRKQKVSSGHDVSSNEYSGISA